MEIEIVDLGASGLSETSGAIWAQALGTEIDEDTGEASDYGKAPMMAALGIAARPAPKDDSGSAQGVCVNASGVDVCIAGHDPRSAKVYGEIDSGETAFFATGKGYDSRALAKKQLFAIIVGDDHIIVVDRKNGQIVLNCPGGAIKVSKADGVVASDASGTATLQLKDGKALIGGEVVLAGRNPVGGVAMSEKVEAELVKIATTLASLSSPPTVPYVYTPASSVKAPGISVGG